jgi:REP element-mobilizing transposase RayT
MPTNTITSPLIPGKYYHIYNQGNNKEKLFYRKANYNYFLRKVDELLSGYIIIYSYCLMPNHFHLLVKVLEPNTYNQFRKLFQSYALSINKQQSRSGSLFRKHFRRKIVTTDTYFKRLVFYIHYNPEKDGFIQDFREYDFSSYSQLIKRGRSKLPRNELFKIFGGIEEFRSYHKIMREQYRFMNLDFENGLPTL